MARRLARGSAVRCACAGVRLWVPLAPRQCAAHSATRRGLGAAGGLRGACALQCAPPCLAPSLAERVQRRGGRVQGACAGTQPPATPQQQPSSSSPACCPAHVPRACGTACGSIRFLYSTSTMLSAALAVPRPACILPSPLGTHGLTLTSPSFPPLSACFGAQQGGVGGGEGWESGEGSRGCRLTQGAPRRCTAHLKRMPPARLHCRLHPLRASGPLTTRTPPPPPPATLSTPHDSQREERESRS
eukprot:1481644-Rhodomonas_salina.2